MALFCSFFCVCVLFLVAKQLYWVDQRVCYGFSIRSYRKNRINFLANPTCVYHILFIHSSVDGHLGCSYVLTIAYSAAMNIGVHVTFHIMIFIQMFVQQWELHDHTVTFLKKKIFRNLQTILYSGCTNLHSYEKRRRVSFCLLPLQHWLFVNFFDDGDSDHCEVIPPCSFDLHFSNNEWYWAYFHLLFSYLCLL